MSHPVGDQLRGSSLFFPLRDAYRCVFKHDLWQAANDRTSFYRQFVKPGELVFDVGANEGEYTRSFLALGARVVAVEPQPQCLRLLRTIRNRRLSIEPVAVGDHFGTATLRVCSDDGMSSLSEEWVERLGKRYSHREWNTRVDVQVVTLDSLIAKHGEPDFIKIDVEGYEPQVLAGLNVMPRGLTFEVNQEWLHAADLCLAWPKFGPDVRFNWWFGASPKRLDSPSWIGIEEMKAAARTTAFCSRSEPCDIIALKTARGSTEALQAIDKE
jgi:FkbM family methyltransferase